MSTRLSIIGGGRLATSVGRLLALRGSVAIQDVLCRSLSDSCRAVDLIGSGRPVTAYGDLRKADLFLIATPDRAIASVAEQLAGSGCVRESSVAFHCSGAESSDLLAALRRTGAATASAHPLMTFTEQPVSREEFAGSYCAIEGNPLARALIERLFAEIGAQTVVISTDQKLLYHAAAVFASNYLMTLLQASLDTLEGVGIAQDVGRGMIAPLVRRSVENALAVGPRDALTGPITRGDGEVVQRHFAALSAANPAVAELYGMLAAQTARLAGVANPLPGGDMPKVIGNTNICR